MGFKARHNLQSINTPYNVGQYCGGCSVHWRLFSTSEDNISTVGDSFSTVEVVQYSWVIASVHAGGITSVLCGDNISTVEGIQ